MTVFSFFCFRIYILREIKLSLKLLLFSKKLDL